MKSIPILHLSLGATVADAQQHINFPIHNKRNGI